MSRRALDQRRMGVLVSEIGIALGGATAASAATIARISTWLGVASLNYVAAPGEAIGVRVAPSVDGWTFADGGATVTRGSPSRFQPISGKRLVG